MNALLDIKEKTHYEVEAEKKPNMLVCKNVKKVYPTPKGEYVVLDDLQLHVKKGEFVSIIGHSGCGKSTLLTLKEYESLKLEFHFY